MGIFRRKKRPSSSTPEPTTSSGAMALPPHNTEAHTSYDLDSEEARILFSNLNIQNQVPEPQWPSPNHQSSSGFQSSSHHQASLNVPSQSNTPSYPDFSWDPPTFPSPANVDTSPNESFDDFSTGLESHSGLTPPTSSPDTFPEYSGPIPMGFSRYGVSAHDDGNNFPSSSQGGGDNLGEHYSTQNWNPVTESLAPDRIEPNFNSNESFSQPFPIEYPTTPMQYSLHASMEAQRLAYEEQQQMMMQQAAETRRQAELSASQARHQAELVHAETMQHRERAWAQAAAVERQAAIANSHIETLHRERERHMAAAEARRGEAEVRRQAAEQRRQEAERYRQEAFSAHPATEPNSESESICPGFIEGEVWDEHGNVTWGRQLCGHDICRMNDWKNSSQSVCNGYVNEEVVDEQGNPKWVSRFCGHQECRNMF